jgi:hypothetical protein
VWREDEGGKTMHATMQRAVDWMRRRAENVVAGLLGIMFIAFLIQIVFRYFFNFLSAGHPSCRSSPGCTWC